MIWVGNPWLRERQKERRSGATCRGREHGGEGNPASSKASPRAEGPRTGKPRGRRGILRRGGLRWRTAGFGEASWHHPPEPVPVFPHEGSADRAGVRGGLSQPLATRVGDDSPGHLAAPRSTADR